MTRIVVDQVNGRVPVVINSGAPGTHLAVHYSRRAQELGADALMILPPSFMPAGPTEVLDYFRTISAAVSIPIFLQDTPSAPIGPELARQLAGECEWVRYIKVESMPITQKVAAMDAAAGQIADHLRRRRRRLLHRGDAPRLRGHHALLQPARGLCRDLEPHAGR